MLALEKPAVGVAAVPGEGVCEVRLWGEAPREALAGDVDREVDALEAPRDACAGEAHPQAPRNAPPGYAVAPVVEGEGRAGKREVLAEGLVLALEDRAALLAGPGLVLSRAVVVLLRLFRILRLVLDRLLGVELGGLLGVQRRAEGPVDVDGGEVGERHAPEALAGGVEAGQLAALAVGHAEGGEGGSVGGGAGAGQVELGQLARDAEDPYDEAVIRGGPGGALVVVGAHRGGAADGEVEEVLEVEDDWAAEDDRAVRDLVRTQLDGVRVAGGRRERGRHRGGACLPDRVLGGADVEDREVLGIAVGEDLGRGRPGLEDEGRPAAAVRVLDQAPARHLHLFASQDDLGRGRVAGHEDDVVHPGEVSPGDLDGAAGREVVRGPVVEREGAAAVDGEVEGAVGAAAGAAELGVVEDRDLDASQGAAVAGEDAAAHDRGAVGVDRPGSDAGLDRVLARVEKRGRRGDVGGDGRIDGRRHSGRVRWQVGGRRGDGEGDRRRPRVSGAVPHAHRHLVASCREALYGAVVVERRNERDERRGDRGVHRPVGSIEHELRARRVDARAAVGVVHPNRDVRSNDLSLQRRDRRDRWGHSIGRGLLIRGSGKGGVLDRRERREHSDRKAQGTPRHRPISTAQDFRHRSLQSEHRNVCSRVPSE